MNPFVDALERAEKLIAKQRAEIERLRADGAERIWRLSEENAKLRMALEKAIPALPTESQWVKEARRALIKP